MASGSASNVLRGEHRQIEIQLDRLLLTVKQRGVDMVSEVREVFAKIQKLMAPHVCKEEMVVYPYLRTRFPELLEGMSEQHLYIAEVAAGVDELTGRDGVDLTERQSQELIQLSKELFDVIQHHIVDEEDQLLPLADLHLSVVEQACLAAQMDNLEIAPMRMGGEALCRCENEGATCGSTDPDH